MKPVLTLAWARSQAPFRAALPCPNSKLLPRCLNLPGSPAGGASKSRCEASLGGNIATGRPWAPLELVLLAEILKCVRQVIKSPKKAAAFTVLSLLWGSTWMAIRIVVMHMPPLRSVSLRFLLASAVLVPIMFLRRERLPVGREWAWLFVLSTLMLAMSFSLVAWAVRRVPTGTTSLLFATSPLLTAWMEPWMGKQSQQAPVSRTVILGMLGGLAGVALVLFRSGSVSNQLQTLGVIAVLSVVVFGSMATIIAKRVLKDIPVLTISAMETLMAGAVLAVASFALERNQPTVWTPQVVWAMLFLSVLSSAAGFFLYYWLLMQIEPHLLQMRYLIMPIIAMFDGYLFLHETITWNMLLGAATVLGSLAFVLRAEAHTDRFRLANYATCDKKGR